MGLRGFRLDAARCREQGQPRSLGKAAIVVPRSMRCGDFNLSLLREATQWWGWMEQGQQSRGKERGKNPGKGMGTPSQGCAGVAWPRSHM